jgi:hypothetical protein
VIALVLTGGMETSSLCLICVLLLQDCVGFVKGETVYCGETYVTGGVGGTEEIIKIEETVVIKDEIPDGIKYPPINKEHEVSLHVHSEPDHAKVLSCPKPAPSPMQ